MGIQRRFLKAISNELLWICLFLGVYWTILDQHDYLHPLLHEFYGVIHIVLALWGFVLLYYRHTRTWNICLVLLLGALVDDTVFYGLSGEVTTTLLFACLSWGCSARLLGIYYSGKLFSQKSSH